MKKCFRKLSVLKHFDKTLQFRTYRKRFSVLRAFIRRKTIKTLSILNRLTGKQFVSVLKTLVGKLNVINKRGNELRAITPVNVCLLCFEVWLYLC